MTVKLKTFGWEKRPKHNFGTSTRIVEPFYHTQQWKKIRLMVLANNPLCVYCESFGYYVSAKVVDHIIPISQGGNKTALDNLQGLCTKCHNSKSGKEKNK